MNSVDDIWDPHDLTDKELFEDLDTMTKRLSVLTGLNLTHHSLTEDMSTLSDEDEVIIAESDAYDLYNILESLIYLCMSVRNNFVDSILNHEHWLKQYNKFTVTSTKKEEQDDGR